MSGLNHLKTLINEGRELRDKDAVCEMMEHMNKYDITEIVKCGFDYIDDIEQYKIFIQYLRDQLNN